jgi:hypothetical protein
MQREQAMRAAALPAWPAAERSAPYSRDPTCSIYLFDLRSRKTSRIDCR